MKRPWHLTVDSESHLKSLLMLACYWTNLVRKMNWIDSSKHWWGNSQFTWIDNLSVQVGSILTNDLKLFQFCFIYFLQFFIIDNQYHPLLCSVCYFTIDIVEVGVIRSVIMEIFSFRYIQLNDVSIFSILSIKSTEQFLIFL